MKSALIAFLAFCLCLPLMGDDAAKKNFEETKELAEKGDAKAQLKLGLMYDIGRGVPKDWREAAKWYLKAAEQGDTKAQKNLGVMYRSGKGVVKDEKEAVKWYRKAAEQGDAGAQTNLGAMYYNGGGILEDYETAYAWFNIAAANGDEYAKRNKLIVTKKMTPAQIAKAQELSREMIKKNPKLLNK